MLTWLGRLAVASLPAQRRTIPYALAVSLVMTAAPLATGGSRW